MSGSIVLEEISPWVYALLLGICGITLGLIYSVWRAIKSARVLWQAGKARQVDLPSRFCRLWIYAVLFRAVLAIGFGWLAWALVGNNHCGFTALSISADTIDFQYCWPFRDRRIATSEIVSLETRASGSETSILEIRTINSKSLLSVRADKSVLRSAIELIEHR